MMKKHKYIIPGAVLFIVIDLFSLYGLGNITSALLLNDNILNAYFGPVYSGIALLCAVIISCTIASADAIREKG